MWKANLYIISTNVEVYLNMIRVLTRSRSQSII